MVIAVGLGVRLPLGVKLAVGDGPGVCVAVGGAVLRGVGVMLGVGVIEGVGAGPGGAEYVAVGGTGVLDGVGVLVGKAMILNVPLLTEYGTDETSGSPTVTLVSVNGEGPVAAVSSTRNTTMASEPSGINFGGVGVAVGVGSGGGGSGVGGKSKIKTLITPVAGYEIFIVLPAESAAEPIATLVMARLLASKFRSKLTIETSAPP